MLTDLIIMSLGCFLLLYFLPRPYDMKILLFLLIPYFVLFFFPVLFLHFNYLNQNRGDIFIFSGCIIVKKKEIEILKYNLEQIREITFYLNGSKGTVNGVLAFSDYYYVKIKLLDDSCFVITSLYSSKIDKILEENFKDVKIKTEKVFYPMILI